MSIIDKDESVYYVVTRVAVGLEGQADVNTVYITDSLIFALRRLRDIYDDMKKLDYIKLEAN